MNKPKYNAYKPLLMTDGVQSWTRHEFDNTKAPTKDDLDKFKQALSAPNLHPIGRIEIMQARLDALETITPTIQIHIDAIRKIHADFLAKNPRTLESLDALEKQNDHWLKIQLIKDVLPLARKKVKANTDARTASQKVRKKDPMREAISRLMVQPKRDHQTFEAFLCAWMIDSVDGFSVKRTDDTYLVSDENGELSTVAYKIGSLRNLYSKAEKVNR